MLKFVFYSPRRRPCERLRHSVTGGMVGIAVAWWGVPAIVRWLPRSFLPDDVAIDVTVPVVLFSAGIAVVTGILFGLSPALQLSRPRVIHGVQPNLLLA